MELVPLCVTFYTQFVAGFKVSPAGSGCAAVEMPGLFSSSSSRSGTMTGLSATGLMPAIMIQTLILQAGQINAACTWTWQTDVADWLAGIAERVSHINLDTVNLNVALRSLTAMAEAEALHVPHAYSWPDARSADFNAKPAFGGPMQVLRYLGRYTHRVAISNHRLLAFEQEHVTFRWKDYARGGKQGEMTLSATEFLRRFFLHVLSRGFVRIRHFGFLANRFRASRLALGRQLLAYSGSEHEVRAHELPESSSLWHCPRCGASMIVIHRFTAAEL